MKYKKTFYFRNGSTLECEGEYKMLLNQLENIYSKKLKKGKISIEYCENHTNIINFKDIQLIRIEVIGVKDEN